MSNQLRCDEIVIIGTVLIAQMVAVIDHKKSMRFVHHSLTKTQKLNLFFSRTFKNNLIHELISFCDTF